MEHAAELMERFARETGLSSDAEPRRYLWTDAHAVCTFLGLHESSGESRWANLARALIHQVHQVLGSHHPEDSRAGPLGRPDHPTEGGLRIGKLRPERLPSEPHRPSEEWDRDGQYFHYLTKWMHALARAAEVLEEPRFARHACELALASTAFLREGLMCWKMSTDLSRPLVEAMGQHDPVDGYVTFLQMETLGCEEVGEPMGRFRSLSEGVRLATPDALGIGGLLFDAFRLHRMEADAALKGMLLAAATFSLERSTLTSGVPEDRLAFRELGLAIGLHGAERMGVLEDWWPLRERIVEFWLDHLDGSVHGDINRVTLATSLAPRGLLGT